mmetsp:Transcript_14032/g.15850  ORF Transcript_14032/g.15850 Transcript_14032/m.15850 type:complete len:396 (-) Transcript_14032:139-1326(-)
MRFRFLQAPFVSLFRVNHHNILHSRSNSSVITRIRKYQCQYQYQYHSFKALRGGATAITTSSESFTTNTKSIPDSTMTSSNNSNNNAIWTINDNEAAFNDAGHIGYSLTSDPESQVGGWLAHRLALEQPTTSSESTTSADSESKTSSSYCWIKDKVASKITKFNYSTMPIGRPPRILVLYGSLRPTSFSKKLAYEFARLLETLGCDVRTYNPKELPVRDPSLENNIKVQELRSLTLWSDGHMWVSPEMHGQITGVFKNQIDWIPLNTGSVRPTQGRTCCVAQVNGGSQSFNAVNTLRLLARWMRMPCCTNQSAVPKAWQEFDDNGRMKESSYRDRVVDVAEEFAKFTAVMAPVSDDLTNRFSERKEKEKEGRLLTQAEKEAKKDITKTIKESRKG